MAGDPPADEGALRFALYDTLRALFHARKWVRSGNATPEVIDLIDQAISSAARVLDQGRDDE